VTRAEGHVGHERPVGGPALIALTHEFYIRKYLILILLNACYCQGNKYLYFLKCYN